MHKSSSIYGIIYVWDNEDTKYRKIIIWAIDKEFEEVKEIIKEHLTVFYDGAVCDDSCLKNDIDDWFDELEEQTKTKPREEKGKEKWQ